MAADETLVNNAAVKSDQVVSGPVTDPRTPLLTPGETPMMVVMPAAANPALSSAGTSLSSSTAAGGDTAANPEPMDVAPAPLTTPPTDTVGPVSASPLGIVAGSLEPATTAPTTGTASSTRPKRMVRLRGKDRKSESQQNGGKDIKTNGAINGILINGIKEKDIKPYEPEENLGREAGAPEKALDIGQRFMCQRPDGVWRKLALSSPQLSLY